MSQENENDDSYFGADRVGIICQNYRSNGVTKNLPQDRSLLRCIVQPAAHNPRVLKAGKSAGVCISVRLERVLKCEHRQLFCSHRLPLWSKVRYLLQLRKVLKSKADVVEPGQHFAKSIAHLHAVETESDQRRDDRPPYGLYVPPTYFH